MASRRIGIELSPDRVTVWIRGDGVVLDEPAVLVRQLRDLRPVAFGNSAMTSFRARPSQLEMVWPLGLEELADPEAAGQLLRQVVLKSVGRLIFSRHELMLAVPAGLSTKGRRALLEAGLSSGARMAHLMDLPLAAALGTGLPVASWRPSAVLILEESCAQLAVVCHDGLLGHRVLARPRQSSELGPWQAPAELGELSATILSLIAEMPEVVQGEIRGQGLMLAGPAPGLELVGPELSRLSAVPTRVVADPVNCAAKGVGIAMDRLEALGSQGLLYLR